MLSKFFLDRPVFAWVIAIILLSLGGLSIYSMQLRPSSVLMSQPRRSLHRSVLFISVKFSTKRLV